MKLRSLWESLFAPREKFLVLEITPQGTNGLFLSVDDDRNIIFEKLERGGDLKKLTEKHFVKGAGRRVVAAADPKLATTIPVPLELPRERGRQKEQITLAELENAIAQAMQKIFNSCRTEAAKRMNINELDAVLVRAKARDFTVDGHAVVSPTGFKARKISLLLELTFTTREIFETLKEFFNSQDEFFFAEAPQARLSSLARVRKLPLNLVVAHENGTSLYVLDRAKGEYDILYRENLEWFLSSLFGRIVEELGVTDDVARNIYEKYTSGEVSEAAARTLKKMMEPQLQHLLREVEKEKVAGSAFFEARHAMPFELPHRHGAVTFEAHPLAEVLGERGFTADEASLKKLGPHLFYFLEAYFDKSSSEINQKLRRRLHWLA